jgi:hypothetical protein
MDNNINNLSLDIYNVLDSSIDHTPSEDLAAEYAMRIGGEMARATLKRDAPRVKGKLWASDLGKECMRVHWYNFNAPTTVAPLQGHTKFKFLYGNILEEAVLYMAEEAGHDVSHQQHRVEWDVGEVNGTEWTVSGRIDGIIDGALMDVKTTSSYGYKKYSTEGIHDGNDSFGYLYQLGFYKAHGDYNVPVTQEGFVWIDKQNGHIKYTICATPDKREIAERTLDIIAAVDTDSVDDVPRAYSPEPYGKSGNECLPMSCSYCSYNKECWKDSNGGRGLRTFAYGHKPIYFTTVTREPKVQEIT